MTRIRVTFLELVAAAIIATGGLSRSLAMRPGVMAGMAVAVSGTALTLASLLALRMEIVIGRSNCGVGAGEAGAGDAPLPVRPTRVRLGRRRGTSAHSRQVMEGGVNSGSGLAPQPSLGQRR